MNVPFEATPLMSLVTTSTTGGSDVSGLGVSFLSSSDEPQPLSTVNTPSANNDFLNSMSFSLLIERLTVSYFITAS
jgi:hypothetical protein